MAAERIPFEVEASRVIELLARQIYQTPLALLRENCQNAFDAILMRIQREGDGFSPLVDVRISSDRVIITDNGIGMGRGEVRNNFWRAGSSGKNNAEARAAGVVGTFGIGAMANFGIATELEVVTESLVTRERTRSFARREELSTSKECISIEELSPTGMPGTVVNALSGSAINVPEAVRYLQSFIMHVPFPIRINGDVASQRSYDSSIPQVEGARSEICNKQVCQGLIADVLIVVNAAADIRVTLTNMIIDSVPQRGIAIFRQGHGTLSTFRNGFGLSPASVASAFSFGGIIDLPLLIPTAGREALSTASLQFLQLVAHGVDGIVAEFLATRPESHLSTGLMTWALQHDRVDLCGHLRIRREPRGEEDSLMALKRGGGAGRVRYYGGNDRSILDAHASLDTPVYVLATRNPRHNVELAYLRKFCESDEIAGQPQVLSARSERQNSIAENAFLIRITSILETDYFVRLNIQLGEISHGLPIHLEAGGTPRLTISASSGGNRTVIELYNSDWEAFPSMVKDYVRSVVFPKIQHLVPSATRQGALAFLKSIQRPRMIFEYERTDMQSLHEIWAEYAEGRLSFTEASNRSRQIAHSSMQVFDQASARPAREVIGDVISNEEVMAKTSQADTPAGVALPAINRSDVSTDAKVLILGPNDPPVRGYRCFISIADRVREDRGDFFHQAHRTSIVWGGQRVLFIFQHFSGEYGLYYDLQASQVVADTSGGGVFDTCTIVMKNRVFIPVPEAVQRAFMPENNERKRFDVRCDILSTGDM